jgi:hypothetical protein
MKRFAVLVAALAVLALAPMAEAYVTLPNGVNPIVKYTEPTTNSDASALTNLKETRIYWKLDAGPETMVIVPAAVATGGQAKTISNILAPVLACQNQILSVQVTAVNTANVEGARSAVATLPVDRRAECSPNMPSALTVQ